MSPGEAQFITLRNSEAVEPSTANEPFSAASWLEDKTRVAIGQGINVSGRLSFAEPVRIEGTFRGDLTSANLIVLAPEGRIEGRIRANRLVVMGELQGSVAGARQVVLGPTARVRGDIEAAVLTIHEGARLDGQVRMPANAEAEPQPARAEGEHSDA